MPAPDTYQNALLFIVLPILAEVFRHGVEAFSPVVEVFGHGVAALRPVAEPLDHRVAALHHGLQAFLPLP